MLSPYGAAKIVNTELAKHQLPQIPPQMMYNYTTQKLNAGKKPIIAFTLEAGVDEKDLQRWLKEYLTKKGVSTKEETELQETALMGKVY